MNDYLSQRLVLQARDIDHVLAAFDLGGPVKVLREEQGVTTFRVENCGAVTADTWEKLEEALTAACPVSSVELTLKGNNLDIGLFSSTDLTLLDMVHGAGAKAPGQALLGAGVDDKPVCLDFGEPGASHVLFLGDGGSGKTAALRTCALSLALGSRQSQVQMVFIAPANGAAEKYGPGLGDLHYLPHALTAVAGDVETAARVLAFVSDELDYRRQRRCWTPSIVLFADDLHLLLRDGGSPIMGPLLTLLAEGSRWGIYVVMAARPVDEHHGGSLDDLLALKAVLRIVGWIADEQRAASITGLAKSGVQHLQGHGDFLLLGKDGPRRFQSAFVDAYDLYGAMESLQRSRPAALLARTYG